MLASMLCGRLLGLIGAEVELTEVVCASWAVGDGSSCKLAALACRGTSLVAASIAAAKLPA